MRSLAGKPHCVCNPFELPYRHPQKIANPVWMQCEVGNVQELLRFLRRKCVNLGLREELFMNTFMACAKTPSKKHCNVLGFRSVNEYLYKKLISLGIWRNQERNLCMSSGGSAGKQQEVSVSFPQRRWRHQGLEDWQRTGPAEHSAGHLSWEVFIKNQQPHLYFFFLYRWSKFSFKA